MEEQRDDLLVAGGERLTPSTISQSTDMATSFAKNVDTAKLKVLENATQTDEKFVEDFKAKLKDATLKLAEVEQSKAEVEKSRAELAQKNVQYEKELVETQQKLNEYKQADDRWTNKERARLYHYNGVKDVMICIGIKNPMCIPLLYALFPIAFIFFLGKCTIQATFGNLLCGAVDSDRPKAMRGFLWTIMCLILVVASVIGIYMFLQYVKIV